MTRVIASFCLTSLIAFCSLVDFAYFVQVKRLLVPFFSAAAVVLLLFLLFNSFEQTANAWLQESEEEPVRFAGLSALILISDIVLPVPSSVVMYINGYVLKTLMGSLLSLASLMISASIGYWLGTLRLLKPEDKRDGFSQRFLERYGVYAILLSRGIPILSESICFVCGFHRMNWNKYMLYNLLGFAPICVLYAYLGEIASQRDAFLLALVLSIVITVLFWLVGFLLNRRRVTV